MKRDEAKADINTFIDYEAKLNRATFAEYKNETFKLYRVNFNRENWKESQCNCISFFEKLLM